MLKAELHVHLEGTIAPDTARKLADRNGLPFPDDLVTAHGHYSWDGFEQFLAAYDRAAAFIRGAQDYSDITYDYLARCAAEDCLYVEFIASDSHGQEAGLSYGAMTEAIADGIDRARAEFGIEARILQSIVRHYGVDQAFKTTQTIVDNPHPYVTGFQMAGAEAMHSVADFAPCFAEARAAGLGLTAHGGEVVGPESVWDLLKLIPGLTRIGHGVRAVEDPALLDELARRDIHLEVCPGSNISIGVFDSFAEHSLPQLVAAGIDCSLASDDPPFFATSIGREYQIAEQELGFDSAQLRQFTRNALDAAFVDDDTRASLLKKLDAES